MQSLKVKTNIFRWTAAAGGFLLLILLAGRFLTAADWRGGAVAGTVELSSGAKGENTLVYLQGISGDYPMSKQPALIDQTNKVFVPHLLPIQKGQAVRFNNHDRFSHNVHLYWGRNTLFNVVQGIDGRHDWTPPRPGEYLILCDIHREMSAFVFVFEHPFFAMVPHDSSPKGSGFRIEGIPDGTYTLVAVRDIQRKLKRQEQTVTIQAGQTSTVRVQF